MHLPRPNFKPYSVMYMYLQSKQIFHFIFKNTTKTSFITIRSIYPSLNNHIMLRKWHFKDSSNNILVKQNVLKQIYFRARLAIMTAPRRALLYDKDAIHSNPLFCVKCSDLALDWIKITFSETYKSKAIDPINTIC